MSIVTFVPSVLYVPSVPHVPLKSDLCIIIISKNGCWQTSVFCDVEEGCPFVDGGVDFGWG
jgi:hypothetical protein